MTRTGFMLFLILMTTAAAGQEGRQAVEMADFMRSNGKIYVVTAVILTIFIGLLIYLIRIDRKMSRMEREE